MPHSKQSHQKKNWEETFDAIFSKKQKKKPTLKAPTEERWRVLCSLRSAVFVLRWFSYFVPQFFCPKARWLEWEDDSKCIIQKRCCGTIPNKDINSGRMYIHIHLSLFLIEALLKQYFCLGIFFVLLGRLFK